MPFFHNPATNSSLAYLSMSTTPMESLDEGRTKPPTSHHYSNHSHNSFSTPSTLYEPPDLRESSISNSEAVVKFKGQEVRAGVVNLTEKDRVVSPDEIINRRINIAKYERSMMTDFHGLLS